MNQWEWHLLEDTAPIHRVTVDGVEHTVGDRVRLRPRNKADIMDVALAGKIGIIESIELDYEGRPQVAIVIEDDPGRDLGFLRQPGHRFFFDVEEIESV
jgi:hypothetical protein